MITEIVGALPGKYLLAALRIPTDSTGWWARGFAVGTSAHARVPHRPAGHADTGACAGLAPGLQVVRASLQMPLVFSLF